MKARLEHAKNAGYVLRYELPWWLAVLWVLGLQMWCPLPIDECFLVLAVVVTLAVPRYRRTLAYVWKYTRASAPAPCALDGCDCHLYAA